MGDQSAPSRPGGSVPPEQYVVVGAIYAVTTALYLRPLLDSFASRIVHFWGDPLLNAYVLAWNQHILVTNPLHLFAANFLYPSDHTIALSDTLVFPALLALPLALFQNPLLVYNALFFASFALSALLWFAVLRNWGLVTVAAFVGGFAFAFLPWRLGQLSHVQLLYTWWIPVAIGSAASWLRSRGWGPALCLGAAVGAQFYTGVYNTFFLALYLVAFVGAGLVATRPPARALPMLALQATAAAAVAAIMVMPALPAYLDMARVLGEPHTLADVARRGAEPADYLRVSPLNVLWGATSLRKPNRYSDVPWEHELFLGFGVMILAVSAVAARLLLRRKEWARRHRQWDPEILMLAVAGLALFVVSLGPVLHWRHHTTQVRLPYEGLYWILPGFSATRVPARAAIFVGLSLSGLAAVALHLWWTMPHRLLRVISLAGGLLVVLESWPHPLPVEANVDYVRHGEVQRMIAGMTPGTVLVLPLDEKLNYLAPLTTVRHFYPLLNGASGHLPPSNGLILAALRAQDWGRRQAEILRVLDVRYIVIDHRNAASTPDTDVRLQRFLDDHGFVSDRLASPVEGLSVVTIARPEDDGVPPRPGAGTFEYTHATQRDPQGAEALVRIGRTAAPILTSRDGREMEVEITGYDRQGARLWVTRMCRRLPDLWLRGQIVDVPIKIPLPRARSTARLTIQLRQAHLGVDRQLEIMLP